MCGIAGIVRFDDQPLESARLHAMRAHLDRRGPDGHGTSLHGRCGLAHARLAVTDLIGGRQPMHAGRDNGHGPLHIVFNGQIYNHRALRRKLVYLGHRFASDHSDTEVLLLGFRQWGIHLPEHIEGMFAFAVWDEDEQQLFLARDRAGQKPLYLRYGERELSFASLPGTIAASAASDESPAVDHQALLNYLRFGYTFSETMVEGVEQLPPGHWMHVQPGGGFKVHRYWHRPSARIRERVGSAAPELRETLEGAVASCMQADVPLGCLLSGGLNSSIVAALAQRSMREQNGSVLRTFSVQMPGMKHEDTAAARAVAEHIGSEHHVLEASPEHALDDLTHLIELIGEPIADPSLLPSYWLCKAAREAVTVALTGEGGDELFGGHERYRALRRLGAHGWWLQFMPAVSTPAAGDDAAWAHWRNLRLPARAGDDPARQYRALVGLFSEEQIRELGVPELEPWTHRDDVPPVPDWPRRIHRVLAALHWDREHALPHDLLRRLDHTSMSVPLEVRSPMLDTMVQELAGHWHPSVLMPRGRPRGLLRAVASPLLPEKIVNRPKRGLAAPMGAWFRDHLREALGDRLFDGTLEELGLRRAGVEKLFHEHMRDHVDHTDRLFALLQLTLWRQWQKSNRASTAAV